MLLNAHNITLLRGQRVVLRQHKLCLHAGQAVHLSGENGSGKTTLLQALAGLSPVAAGTIERHTELLYLGHKSALQPHLSVRENLYYSARLYHGLSEEACQSALPAALEALNLTAHQHREARYLSAGQHHKTQLARLFLPNTAPIWLLDEPLTALDTASTERVLARIDAHLSDGGAVVMTTHHAFSLPNHPLIPHAL